jgi:hypothetical protein
VVGVDVEVGVADGSVGIAVSRSGGVDDGWIGVALDAMSSGTSAGDVHCTSPRDITTSATKITTIACGRNIPDRRNIQLLGKGTCLGAV